MRIMVNKDKRIVARLRDSQEFSQRHPNFTYVDIPGDPDTYPWPAPWKSCLYDNGAIVAGAALPVSTNHRQAAIDKLDTAAKTAGVPPKVQEALGALRDYLTTLR